MLVEATPHDDSLRLAAAAARDPILLMSLPEAQMSPSSLPDQVVNL